MRCSHDCRRLRSEAAKNNDAQMTSTFRHAKDAQTTDCDVDPESTVFALVNLQPELLELLDRRSMNIVHVEADVYCVPEALPPVPLYQTRYCTSTR